nr:hypothetical protein [Cressdnaviricota sp.]
MPAKNPASSSVAMTWKMKLTCCLKVVLPVCEEKQVIFLNGTSKIKKKQSIFHQDHLKIEFATKGREALGAFRKRRSQRL